jgi:AraC-like DNA-binding protein
MSGNMHILSKDALDGLARSYGRNTGLGLSLLDARGNIRTAGVLPELAGVRKACRYAIQESMDLGAPSLFSPVAGVTAWVVAMEDCRVLRGGLLSGPVFTGDKRLVSASHAADCGMDPASAERWVAGLQAWTVDRARLEADALYDLFYGQTGWRPEQMLENRLRIVQRAQSRQAAGERSAIYAFEKERRLLANIRAGDRPAAREILNDMLADIYLSSPKIPVLRARTIELISCLTRAAIEDNPLLEPLIERNHIWTENLIRGRNFEEISQVLMDALDDFSEAIYMHGVNRTNEHVRRALDHIRDHYAEPLRIVDIASVAGLSPSRLQHLVKDFTGRTLVGIAQERRIRQAEHLLQRTSKTCAEIAYEVGFCDQSHLVRQFRKITGTTPGAYRRRGASGGSNLEPRKAGRRTSPRINAKPQ